MNKTIRAYNELYLNDTQLFLAHLFDYVIRCFGMETNLFGQIFVNSSICKNIEIGNPSLISGKAGEEAAKELINSVIPNASFPQNEISFERSPSYWAGYYLAYYQWYTSKRFKDIFLRIPLKEIIDMYKIYHEMDVSIFVDDLNKRYDSVALSTKLKTIREARSLSQNELAKLSDVSLRSIQLYEQKVNDIDKAQAQTLYKLARVLGCSIEDILENPEKNY